MKKLHALLIALPLVFLPVASWAGDDDSRMDKIIEFLFGSDGDDDPEFQTDEDAFQSGSGDGASSKKRRVRVTGGDGGGSETGGPTNGDGGQGGPSPAVPEPTGAIAFGLGALLLGRLARARRR